jgi:hypothetical protein
MTSHFENALAYCLPPIVVATLQKTHEVLNRNHEFADFLSMADYTIPPPWIQFTNKKIPLYPQH